MDGPNRKPFDVHLFLATAGPGRRIIVLKAKGVAFVQGQPADSVFFLQSGRANLTVVSKRGKEATVTLLVAGNFFGEEAMTNADVARTSTATALTLCSMLKIERKEMLRVLHDEHRFSDFFLQFLLTKSAKTEEDLIDQLFNSSERGLARTLLLMAEFGQPGEPETLLPPVTQEALAEMIGTTRSRVSFFMNRFRKLGYIDYNGRIRVHKSLLNVVLQDRLRNAKSRCDLAQETERQAIAARHEQQRARDTADHELKTLRREATEAEQSFATTCDTMNIEYAEANSLLGISTEAREELRGRLAAIETKLSDAANAEVIRGDDMRALGADSENVPDDRTADATLQAELQRLEENCSTLMQLIGGIDQQLQADDRGRSAAAELRQQLDTHAELLRAWAEVEEAIGSREGDRFRTFAQSITLEHLVQLANHHLQSISPRYQLSKGGDDKLALHIVDCEMDSERRSTRSLSGGERFLVSLALALALSGLNGRQSFVDTLFIDEGFGALDPDTLEIAVSALEILQSLGRKVGIVTHVEGMKDRLPVQVRVEKMGGGRSRLRLFPE